MRSAQKKTPASEKKNGKEPTSGKKLVQARLPFKILAGTPPEVTLDVSVPIVKLDVSPKKRKLSYTEVSENPKKIGKSDSKENLTLIKTDTPVANDDVIVLDDEVSDEPSNILSPKTPVASSKAKQSNKNTPRSTGSSTTPKVQIKLPLSGKKKKRKSKRVSRSSKNNGSDSSDIELVSDEHQNPPKKVKTTPQSEQGLPEANVGLPNPENDKAHRPSSKEDAISNLESVSKTKTAKENDLVSTQSSIKDNLQNTSSTVKRCREELKITQDAENKESSSMQKKSTHKELPSVSLKDSSIEQDSSVPTLIVAREKKAARRSARQCETDQKKEENCSSEEKVSSEPDIVSEKSSTADTSINNEMRKKLLTPKQLKLMEQRKKVREEKELKLQQLKEEKERKLQEQREERERKLQDEKVQKQKEREERELQRKKEREEKEEQKRREKEEKEEQRRKEKEEKERKRLSEIEVKNEEKRKRDEAKEEERRKKEEDRRRKELDKEEEENKKKKAAQAFTKFFVTKTSKPPAEDDQESRDDAESVDSLAFRPFQVKGDMKLAPLVRREFKKRSREELDSFLKGNQIAKETLYIGELRKGTHIPLRGSKTVLKDNDDDEVVIIENDLETAAQAIDEARPKQIEKYKAKFYSFRENRRPPFYGTWRKRSTVITPRKPFATDKKFFDYEVDSDDEWEEEEPGESLNGSEDEKDESEDEDYEVDNEWFVPHGHLSDEELQNEDEIGPDTSREAQKAKLKALQQEFAQEMKKKTEKIKPRLIGAIWEDENGNRPNLCPNVIWDSVCARAMILCEPMLVEEPESVEPEPSTPPPEKQKRLEITKELMTDLVRLVHGNRHSRVFLIKEYIEHVCSTCDAIKNGECLAPTKSLIREKIDEISEWSVVDANSSKKKNKKKLCWVVSADILEKYSLGNLGLRNEWSYKLQPKFDKDKNDNAPVTETQVDTVNVEMSKTPKNETFKKQHTDAGITKFAKVLTKKEKQNQLNSSGSAASASPNMITASNAKTAKPKASSKTKTPETPTVTPIVGKLTSPSSVINKIAPVKKRVALLMSVPPGQQISPESKNVLISKFLQKNKTTSTASDNEKSVSLVTHMNVDNAIIID